MQVFSGPFSSISVHVSVLWVGLYDPLPHLAILTVFLF